jgi:hypothetical protein
MKTCRDVKVYFHRSLPRIWKEASDQLHAYTDLPSENMNPYYLEIGRHYTVCAMIMSRDR